MGQDIHMVIEAKFGDKWVAICDPDKLPATRKRTYAICSDRWYSLWYYMCGAGRWPAAMRSESHGLALFDPRGLPPDISELSQIKFSKEGMGDEYHTHSWLTLNEFVTCYQVAYENATKEDPVAYPPRNNDFTPYDIIGDLFGYRYYASEIRFVFAFDN